MQNRSTLPLSQPTTHPQTRGWISGFLGMLIFSGSLPATRVAVLELDPLFLTAIRATLAALLAAGTLLILRQPRPQRGDWLPLCLVAVGVVLGFPLLTALALQHTTSAHSLVYIGLLPLATACFGVLRGGERPKAAFWLFSLAGAALVAGFALSHGTASGWQGDALMLGAIALCGLGYAEGAVLTRRLGDWQVISWALVISLPLSAVAAVYTVPAVGAAISAQAWLALGYVSLFSMWIGFIFWYRGLALGGIAAVGQLQLLQPFFGLLLAGLLLHEEVQTSMIAVMLGVLVCVFGAKRFSR
ncbi:DMT family transporter [Cedecea neteri]|uniref:DMT family transporter n=1 Tax=Cedecea neteri TaxID=158822 RepID=UPI0028A18AFD|nr:DMT family transporter [Cedecea neteri]